MPDILPTETSFLELLSQGNEGWAFTTPEGEILRVNEKFAQMMGIEKRDCKGQNWLEKVPPDDRFKLAAGLEGGSVEPLRARLTGWKGVNHWLEIRMVPTTDNQRLCWFRPLQLSESNEGLQEFIQAVPDLFAISSADGYFVQLNDAWKRLLGFTNDELQSRPLLDFVDPEDRESTRAAIKQAITEGEVQLFENRYLSKEEGSRCLSWTARAAQDKRLVFWSGRDITVYREAENKIKKSEALYRGLVENIPDMLTELDSKGKILFVNRVRPGMALKDLIGQNWFDFIADSDKQLFQTALEVVQKTGNAVDIELETNSRLGRAWWHFIMVPIWVDGQVDRLLSIGRDISALKQSENRLKRNEEHFHMAQRVAGIGSWEHDFLTQSTTFSEELLGLLGAEDQPLNSIHEWLGFIHPEDRSQAANLMGTAMEKRLPFDTQYRVLFSNGTVRVHESRARVFIDPETQTDRMIGINVDITEKFESEKQLHQKERLYRTIAQNFPRGVVLLIDKNFHINFAEGQLLSSSKLGADHFLGKTIHEAFEPKVVKKLEPELHKSFEGDSCTFEYSQKGKFMVSNTFPLHNRKGEVESVLVVQQDLSERKRSEDELKRLNVELIKHNNELRQFAYITSHNLRAPIANILALVDMYSPGEDNQDIISNLRKSATNLDSVISDLNEIVAYRNSKSEVKEQINLEVELDKVLSSIDKNIRDSGAIITQNFEEVSQLYSVKNYIHSFFINLLTNAIKYRSPDRVPEIEVSARLEGRWIVLRVKDNGLGIDLSKYKGSLFGMYKRFHNHVEGKGLGLHLVKTQAEALRGKVEIESQPGEGSTFKILLPER
ncbi:MAG: PAS domain S-box protein [Salibacteraceae bacterium]